MEVAVLYPKLPEAASPNSREAMPEPELSADRLSNGLACVKVGLKVKLPTELDPGETLLMRPSR